VMNTNERRLVDSAASGDDDCAERKRGECYVFLYIPYFVFETLWNVKKYVAPKRRINDGDSCNIPRTRGRLLHGVAV